MLKYKAFNANRALACRRKNNSTDRDIEDDRVLYAK